MLTDRFDSFVNKCGNIFSSFEREQEQPKTQTKQQTKSQTIIQPETIQTVSEVPEFFKLLGCTPDQGLEKAKSNYRKLSVEYHPDKQPGNHNIACKLNDAYEKAKEFFSDNTTTNVTTEFNIDLKAIFKSFKGEVRDFAHDTAKKINGIDFSDDDVGFISTNLNFFHKYLKKMGVTIEDGETTKAIFIPISGNMLFGGKMSVDYFLSNHFPHELQHYADRRKKFLYKGKPLSDDLTRRIREFRAYKNSSKWYDYVNKKLEKNSAVDYFNYHSLGGGFSPDHVSGYYGARFEKYPNDNIKSILLPSVLERAEETLHFAKKYE